MSTNFKTIFPVSFTCTHFQIGSKIQATDGVCRHVKHSIRNTSPISRRHNQQSWNWKPHAALRLIHGRLCCASLRAAGVSSGAQQQRVNGILRAQKRPWMNHCYCAIPPRYLATREGCCQATLALTPESWKVSLQDTNRPNNILSF